MHAPSHYTASMILYRLAKEGIRLSRSRVYQLRAKGMELEAEMHENEMLTPTERVMAFIDKRIEK